MNVCYIHYAHMTDFILACLCILFVSFYVFSAISLILQVFLLQLRCYLIGELLQESCCIFPFLYFGEENFKLNPEVAGFNHLGQGARMLVLFHKYLQILVARICR